MTKMAAAARRKPVTQLWQRLRAARAYADMKQQDVADAMRLLGQPISRPALALWESAEERNRTMPKPEQVVAFAKACKVPAMYLLDDTQRDDVLAVRAYTENHTTHDQEAQDLLMTARAFWMDVKKTLLASDPDVAPYLDKTVRCPSGIEFQLALKTRRSLVSCTHDTSATEHTDALLVREIGYLLMAELAVGAGRHDRVLMIFGAKKSQIDADALEQRYGVRVLCFGPGRNEVVRAANLMAKM